MCEYCENGKEIKSYNFLESGIAIIGGNEINLHGDEKKVIGFANIFSPSFKIQYCPMCGRKLTGTSDKEEMKPIIHAHAITDWLGDSKCSNCGSRNVDVTEPYCQHCGARLDEPEERED